MLWLPCHRTEELLLSASFLLFSVRVSESERADDRPQTDRQPADRTAFMVPCSALTCLETHCADCSSLVP